MEKQTRDEVKKMWAEHIEKQAKSGSSIAAYCRDNNLDPSRFNYYRNTLKTNGNIQQNTSVRSSNNLIRIDNNSEEIYDAVVNERITFKVPASKLHRFIEDMSK